MQELEWGGGGRERVEIQRDFGLIRRRGSLSGDGGHQLYMCSKKLILKLGFMIIHTPKKMCLNPN